MEEIICEVLLIQIEYKNKIKKVFNEKMFYVYRNIIGMLPWRNTIIYYPVS